MLLMFSPENRFSRLLVEQSRTRCLNSSEALPQATMIKTVVRKTFLELEEDLGDGDGRPMRRTKSEELSDALSL